MIELQTSAEWVKTQVECETGVIGRPDPDTHDAAVAHALMQAISEIAEPESGYGQPTKVDYMRRAAEILRTNFGIE